MRIAKTVALSFMITLGLLTLADLSGILDYAGELGSALIGLILGAASMTISVLLMEG